MDPGDFPHPTEQPRLPARPGTKRAPSLDDQLAGVGPPDAKRGPATGPRSSHATTKQLDGAHGSEHRRLVGDADLHLAECHLRLEAAQSVMARIILGDLDDAALDAVIELVRRADLELRAVTA